MSQNIKLRLTLDVEFDPQGMTVAALKHNLHQVVKDATGNGTLTGETPATVENYSFTVQDLDEREDGCAFPPQRCR